MPAEPSKGEFHISGLGNALKFWGGVFISLISIAFFSIHWIAGHLVWLLGVYIIVRQIYRNYQESRMNPEKKIYLINMILKIIFLLALVGLLVFMDFNMLKNQ